MSNIQSQNLGRQIEVLLRKNYPKRFEYLYDRPLLAAGIYAGALYIFGLLASLSLGYFSSNNNVIGLSDDKVFIIGTAVLGLAIYYYLSLPMWVGNAFDSLVYEEVFLSAEIQLSPSISKLCSSKWVPRTILGIVMVVIILWIVTALISSETVWWESNGISFLLILAIWFPSWYAAAGVLVNYVLASLVINKLLKDNQIVVHTVHPDGSGGLGALGKFSLRMSYIAVAYGVILIIWGVSTNQSNIYDNYGFLIQLVFYVITIPVLFYIPLRSAHKAMLEFRNALSLGTANRYWQEHKEVHREIASNSLVVLEEKINQLDVLKNLSEQEQSYPVWPFDTHIRRAVIFNTLIPVILAAISFIVDLIALYTIATGGANSVP